MKIKLLVVFVVAFALLTVPAFAKTISVGQFALKYADSLGLHLTNAQDAITSLAERGLIDRNVMADSVLTEKDLVDILGRAGIQASTSSPASGVDESTVNSIIPSLTIAPGSDDSSSNPNGNSGGSDDGNNNGKKTRPKGQMPNSRANPNAFYGREDEG